METTVFFFQPPTCSSGTHDLCIRNLPEVLRITRRQGFHERNPDPGRVRRRMFVTRVVSFPISTERWRASCPVTQPVATNRRSGSCHPSKNDFDAKEISALSGTSHQIRLLDCLLPRSITGRSAINPGDQGMLGGPDERRFVCDSTVVMKPHRGKLYWGV